MEVYANESRPKMESVSDVFIAPVWAVNDIALVHFNLPLSVVRRGVSSRSNVSGAGPMSPMPAVLSTDSFLVAFTPMFRNSENRSKVAMACSESSSATRGRGNRSAGDWDSEDRVN